MHPHEPLSEDLFNLNTTTQSMNFTLTISNEPIIHFSRIENVYCVKTGHTYQTLNSYGTFGTMVVLIHLLTTFPDVFDH